MGDIAHRAVLITIAAYALDRPEYGPGLVEIEAFRAALPEELQPLLVGPIQSPVNGYHTLAFLPDGSKEGWDASDEGDAIRAKLIEMFSYRHDDGNSPYSVVEVRYGGDEPRKAALTYVLKPEPADTEEGTPA